MIVSQNRYHAIGTKVLLLSPSSVSVIAWAGGNLSAVAIREAIAGHENQVMFISEPNHGMYEAINKGIRRATGDVLLCVIRVTLCLPRIRYRTL